MDCGYLSFPGDVLSGSVHHAEAAVRPEAAAHRPLRSGRSGPSSGRGQLLCEGAAVSLTPFLISFCFKASVWELKHVDAAGFYSP